MIVAAFAGFSLSLKNYIVNKSDLYIIYVLVEISDLIFVTMLWIGKGISAFSMKEMKKGLMNTMKTQNLIDEILKLDKLEEADILKE